MNKKIKIVIIATLISIIITSGYIIKVRNDKYESAILQLSEKVKEYNVLETENKRINQDLNKETEASKKLELEMKVKESEIDKLNKSLKEKDTYIDKLKSETMNILVSYYTNSIEDCGKTDAISASGKNLNLSRGQTYVAAPTTIPFGTTINIKGIGLCVVEDRGGAIKYTYIDGVKYMKIDVFVPGATRQELLNKGIVKTKGRIISG